MGVPLIRMEEEEEEGDHSSAPGMEVAAAEEAVAEVAEEGHIQDLDPDQGLETGEAGGTGPIHTVAAEVAPEVVGAVQEGVPEVALHQEVAADQGTDHQAGAEVEAKARGTVNRPQGPDPGRKHQMEPEKIWHLLLAFFLADRKTN